MVNKKGQSHIALKVYRTVSLHEYVAIMPFDKEDNRMHFGEALL